jgi:hypothetical protein
MGHNFSSLFQGPDKATRGWGVEWESIKISWGNLAYVPKLTQRIFLLTRSKSYNYRQATDHRNQLRNPKPEWKHTTVQEKLRPANSPTSHKKRPAADWIKKQSLASYNNFFSLTCISSNTRWARKRIGILIRLAAQNNHGNHRTNTRTWKNRTWARSRHQGPSGNENDCLGSNSKAWWRWNSNSLAAVAEPRANRRPRNQCGTWKAECS